jgi:hypothetical protein
MKQKQYDRAAEDLGNVVLLEHVNVLIDDQRPATAFYVAGLGLTRDPYLMTSIDNMWVNAGRSQFHMPHGKPQVLRGHVGLVLPDRAALLERLARVRKHLDGTKFAVKEYNDYVEATSPWGNKLRCYEPDAARFGRVTLAMPYVEFDVAPGTADGIARFYREVLETPATAGGNGEGRCARVAAGAGQELVFRETDAKIPAYDGHHFQIYLANFSKPHRWLKERGLVFEESDQHQYRFKDIVDVETGKVLYTVEHEIRSMRHPLYNRPLVNKNPNQSNTRFAAGHEVWPWVMPFDDG